MPREDFRVYGGGFWFFPVTEVRVVHFTICSAINQKPKSACVLFIDKQWKGLKLLSDSVFFLNPLQFQESLS